MNKKIFIIIAIIILIGAVVTLFFIDTDTEKADSLSNKELQDLTSDHLDEALLELDQIDFEIST